MVKGSLSARGDRLVSARASDGRGSFPSRNGGRAQGGIDGGERAEIGGRGVVCGARVVVVRGGDVEIGDARRRRTATHASFGSRGVRGAVRAVVLGGGEHEALGSLEHGARAGDWSRATRLRTGARVVGRWNGTRILR